LQTAVLDRLREGKEGGRDLVAEEASGMTRKREKRMKIWRKRKVRFLGWRKIAILLILLVAEISRC
jgi:hypothetical protein